MGLVFDTSVLIAAERGVFDLDAFLKQECASESVFISAITASERLHGWERAPKGKKKLQPKRFVEDVLKTIPILDFDLSAARKHAHLWAALEGKGKMIGAHHMLIAAICLSSEHKLVTLNVKEFRQVPKLKLVPTKKYLTE